MDAWGVAALVVVLVLSYFYARRARGRAAAEDLERASRIGIGAEVMTTSGLYGVVTSRNDDTVLLRIAPGVEVKWALAALRDADSLSDRYRHGMDEPGAGPEGAGDMEPGRGASGNGGDAPGPTTV